MVATVYPPFGTYGTPQTMSTTSSAAKATILANITALKNLIPTAESTDAGGRAVTYAPDFDKIPPATAAKLHVELDALHATISRSMLTT